MLPLIIEIAAKKKYPDYKLIVDITAKKATKSTIINTLTYILVHLPNVNL